jgi:hypothetical protein
MMLAAMLVVLLIFTLLGMEIAWAIALSCFAYIALSQLTDNPTACASAIPRRPMPEVGIASFTTTTAAAMNTRANVPSASATNRRLRDGMRDP